VDLVIRSLVIDSLVIDSLVARSLRGERGRPGPHLLLNLVAYSLHEPLRERRRGHPHGHHRGE
jgi:hypothetical protein